MTRISGRLTALAVVPCAPVAMATPLSTLTGGGTLTIADVTFGSFSFTDTDGGFDGGLTIDPAAIDVTTFSTAATSSPMEATTGSIARVPAT